MSPPSLLQQNNEDETSSPWNSLPSDVLERALALLPLPDVFRMRLVCKRWNQLIHCAHFQKMSLSSSSWGPFFSPRVGWKGKGLSLVPWSCYDHETTKWVTLPELLFPSWASRKCGWNLMAADGGLLCFGACDGKGGLLVCNPMTNRWKIIPVRGPRAPVISHMMVEEKKRSYRILFAGSAAFTTQPDVRFTTTHQFVDVYDSLSRSWTLSAPLSSSLHFRSGAHCGGAFYILTRHLITGAHAVVILDLSSLTWRNPNHKLHSDPIPIPIVIPDGLAYPYVVACSGNVYLVGGSSEATDRTPVAGILLYELRCVGECECEWVKVSEYVNLPFLRSTGAIYGCGAWGSRIHVVTYAYDMWVAVFDCKSRVWGEPIKGNFFDMKDVFESKFRVQPNLCVAP